jgi:hypothetical protein
MMALFTEAAATDRFAAPPHHCTGSMNVEGRTMTSEFQHKPPDGSGVERWQRLTDDPDIRGVEVTRSQTAGSWQWSLTVAVMEFIREDPLESEIRRAMAAELRAVPGVARVHEEDREVWVVDGSPSGEKLIQAAAKVVDRFAERAREHYDNLGA